MNHLNKIHEQLAKYDIEAMLVTGEAGEHYAVNFHGEGVVLAAGIIPTPDILSLPKSRSLTATSR